MKKIQKIKDINTTKKALIISKYYFEMVNCRVIRKDNLLFIDFAQIKDLLELYPEYQQVILSEEIMKNTDSKTWIKRLEKKYPKVMFVLLEESWEKDDC